MSARSGFSAGFRGDKYLNWKRMIDHIAAVVLVMIVGLHATRIFGAGHQCVSSCFLRRHPIKLPAPPRMALRWIEELRPSPGEAAIGAHRYFGNLTLARPCSA